MSQKFQAAVHHRDEVTYVKLSGVIDEDNELTDLGDKIPSGAAVIDLGEIERINSCGVRDWVNWLGKIEKNNTNVVLVECSPAIVAQINLVNNFTGNGMVKSFYVPYFCPECDEEKVLLVETADMGPPPHEPPTCRCDECDLVMDFDDMPDSYFAFLGNHKQVAEPNGIGKVIDEFSAEDSNSGEKSRIKTRTGNSGISSHSMSSLPSVPSLPSITGGGDAGPGSRGSRHSSMALSNANLMSAATGASVDQPSSAPPAKSGAIVYILVGVLLAAVGVLAFLFLSGQ